MVILKHIKGPSLEELEKILSKVQKSIIIQGTPHLEGSTWYVHYLVQDLDGLESDIKLKQQTTTSNTKTTKVALKDK